MKKLTILFLFIVGSAVCQVYKPIEFPAKADKKYIINPVKDEEKYRTKVANKIPRKHLKSFTQSVAYGKSQMFRDGEIYMSWPELEYYLNKVLDSIIPTSLASKKIHVFIGRSSEINAFCLYDGTMIINAGLFAEVKSEAALVSVMGHELAHFIKTHLLNDYINSVKKDKKKKRNGKNELDLTIEKRGYAQLQELEADAVGFDITKNAKYDLSEAISNFELFIREKDYYNKRHKSELINNDSLKIKTGKGRISANTLEKLLSTHPQEKERKEKLSEFIKQNPQTNKKLYKLDENLFGALQKQARLETINILFEQHNYKECLERAFIYHLFDPENTTIIYYIAECLRRECLLDYRLKKQGFLTYNMQSESIKNDLGILQDLHYMVVDENRFQKIKAAELLDKSVYEFKSYLDAYYYFAGLLEKKDFAEVYLMNALFENDKKKIESNIEKYLSKPLATRKEYAKHYRAGTLSKSVSENSGEIVLVPGVDYYSHLNIGIKGYTGTRYDYKFSETRGGVLAGSISDKLSKMKNTKGVSVPRETINNFNSKIKYENVMAATLLASRDENEGLKVVHYYKELENEDYIGRIELFRFSPEVWQFFYDNKINAITSSGFYSHQLRAVKRVRIYFMIMAPVTLGLTLLYLPAIPDKGREIDMYSYNAKMGSVLHYFALAKRKPTARRCARMFKKGRKHINKFIKNYEVK